MGPRAGADPGWAQGREQILDGPKGGSRSGMGCGAARQACAQARCASCMFFTIAASTACSSTLGLNWTNSVPAVGQRYVAGRRVERVAGFGDLVMVGETMGQLALEHISPVRAVAAVAGQPLEQRGSVDVLAERHKIDRVAVDLA